MKYGHIRHEGYLKDSWDLHRILFTNRVEVKFFFNNLREALHRKGWIEILVYNSYGDIVFNKRF